MQLYKMPLNPTTPREEESTDLTTNEIQALTIPFISRSIEGKVSISYRVNTDAAHAWGLDVVYGNVPPSQIPLNFFGFPVITAHVFYGPHDLGQNPAVGPGYAALFGWIQFVKQVAYPPGQDPETRNPDEGVTTGWGIDVYPFEQTVNSPFATFGWCPNIFDAPAISLDQNPNNNDFVWRAQSYLCVLSDLATTQEVKLVPGVGFGWGFDLIEGPARGGDRKIVVKRVEPLPDLCGEWNGRLEYLRGRYPGWTFDQAV